jgi:Arc/MetJ-type ribon-helix-helix transcriptional regulator
LAGTVNNTRPPGPSLVHVRLTPTEGAALAEIVERGRYRSNSDAIRAGLLALFQAEKLTRAAGEAIARERVFHRPRRRRSSYLRVLPKQVLEPGDSLG